MQSHLAEHFRSVRLSRGVSLGQLARLVGYRNISKGSRRISTFEQSGEITDNLLTKLTDALGIGAVTIAELKKRDHQEWERWASEPVQPFLVIRVFAVAYCRKKLPDEIKDIKQAEAWAAEVARKVQKRVCLVWNRRELVYFDREGRIERAMTTLIPPTMTLSGKPIQSKVTDPP